MINYLQVMEMILIYPLAIDGVFKMGDMSGGNCSMNNHNIYQQDCGPNNGDVINGNGFINSHTIFQCDDSSTFKDMDGDVENVDVSCVYGSMNRQNVYQLNGLK